MVSVLILNMILVVVLAVIPVLLTKSLESLSLDFDFPLLWLSIPILLYFCRFWYDHYHHHDYIISLIRANIIITIIFAVLLISSQSNLSPSSFHCHYHHHFPLAMEIITINKIHHPNSITHISPPISKIPAQHILTPFPSFRIHDWAWERSHRETWGRLRNTHYVRPYHVGV